MSVDFPVFQQTTLNRRFSPNFWGKLIQLIRPTRLLVQLIRNEKSKRVYENSLQKHAKRIGESIKSTNLHPAVPAGRRAEELRLSV